MIAPVEIFCCYAHEDQQLLNALKAHLMPLQRQGFITLWTDTDISAGTEWEKEINKHLNTAQIILLLISPAFMNSDFCYSHEMQRAMQRHEQRETRVIPIILRPVYWEQAPFSKLRIVPSNEKPIAIWDHPDEAYENIAKEISKVIKERSPTSVHISWSDVQKETPITTLLPNQLPQAAGGTNRPGLHTYRFSRRAITISLLGLAGTAALGSGIIWYISSHRSLSSSRLGVTLYTYHGHSADVLSVARSPEGKRITSGSRDNTMQVWDREYGYVYDFHKHPGAVNTVAWSPDGDHIASGSSDGKIHIWNAGDGSPAASYSVVQTSTIFLPNVLSIAWSLDGKYLASATDDKMVRTWNSADGTLIFTYAGHSDAVNGVAWSPDGTRIASASSDKTVHIWNPTDEADIFIYQGHSNDIFGYVNAVAWSPNGTRLASASSDETVQVWDPATGGNVLTYHGHSDAVNAIVWFTNGKYLISGSNDKTVQVWTAG